MLKKIICGIIFVIGVLINCNAEITPLEVPKDSSQNIGAIWKCDTKDEVALLIEDFELNYICPYNLEYDVSEDYYVIFLYKPRISITEMCIYHGIVFEVKKGVFFVKSYYLTRK